MVVGPNKRTKARLPVPFVWGVAPLIFDSVFLVSGEKDAFLEDPMTLLSIRLRFLRLRFLCQQVGVSYACSHELHRGVMLEMQLLRIEVVLMTFIAVATSQK